MKSEGELDDSEHINRIVRSRDTLKSRRGGMAVYDKVALEDMALQANVFIGFDDYVGLSGPIATVAVWTACQGLLHSDRCLLSFSWIHRAASAGVAKT